MSEPISPNGRAVLTLKKKSGIAVGILTILTTTTLPSLHAAGVRVPAWIPIALGALLGAAIMLATFSGGVRSRKPKVKLPVLP